MSEDISQQSASGLISSPDLHNFDGQQNLSDEEIDAWRQESRDMRREYAYNLVFEYFAKYTDIRESQVRNMTAPLIRFMQDQEDDMKLQVEQLRRTIGCVYDWCLKDRENILAENYHKDSCFSWMVNNGISSVEKLKEIHNEACNGEYFKVKSQKLESEYKSLQKTLKEKIKTVETLGDQYEKLKIENEGLATEKDKSFGVMCKQNAILSAKLEKTSTVINQLRAENVWLKEDKEEVYERMSEESSVLLDELEKAYTLIDQLSTINGKSVDTEDNTSFVDSDLLEKSKMLVKLESSKFMNSDTECLESEIVSNHCDGGISDEKLEDYCNVTSVLCERDSVAVVGLSEEEAVKGITVKSFDFVEESAKGIADKSGNMLCGEDQDRDQRSDTEGTRVTCESIDVCEEHSEAEDFRSLLCCEVEASEMDQSVCPRNSQVVIKQQSLQKKNMVDEVIKGFKVLEKVRGGSVEQVCKKTNVSIEPTSNEVSSQENDKEEFEDENDATGKDMEAPDKHQCQSLPEIVRHQRVTVQDHTKESAVTEERVISSLQKPRLQKTGDVADRDAFEIKSKRRTREEPRPRTDPPKVVLDCIDSRLHMLHKSNHGLTCTPNRLQEPLDPHDRSNSNSNRIKEEPRPRKDPPTQFQWKLSGSYGRQEWKPLKDPPRTCHQEYAQYHLLKAPIWSNCASLMLTMDYLV